MDRILLCIVPLPAFFGLWECLLQGKNRRSAVGKNDVIFRRNLDMKSARVVSKDDVDWPVQGRIRRDR